MKKCKSCDNYINEIKKLNEIIENCKKTIEIKSSIIKNCENIIEVKNSIINMLKSSDNSSYNEPCRKFKYYDD